MSRLAINALAVAATIAATSMALPAYGATVNAIGPAELGSYGSCTSTSHSAFFLLMDITGTNDDGGGRDALAVHLLDGNNVIINRVSGAFNFTSQLVSANLPTFYTPTARPFKFVLYDLGPGEAMLPMGATFDITKAMPGGLVEFDPATIDPSCGVYPDINAPPPPAPAPEPPTAAISNFLQARVDLLLANVPGIDRRIARMSGAPAASTQEPGAAVMGFVSTLAHGSPLPVSTSLAAIEAMSGAVVPSPFDIWIDGTFALFDNAGPHGRFSTASLGADYLINPDLLVGGFLSLDRIDQFNWATTDTLTGTGWLAGPYLTARLSENLYLDLLAGAGTADNTIDTGLGFVDGFDSTRWLVNATLSGSFTSGPWSFIPRLGVSYGEETSAAYTDSAGTAVPSITAGLGQITAGPGIVHTSEFEGGTQALSLRLDAMQRLGSISGFSARPEAGVNWAFDGGLQLGATATYSGLGSTRQSVGVSLNASGGF